MKKQLSVFILIFSFISVSEIAHSRDFPYADAVPFLGLEDVAQSLKKAVFCVQSEGNLSNDTTDDDWVSHGTGFFMEGKNKEYIGITCRHVVLSLIKEKKQFFAGFDTDKGYLRLVCEINHINNKYDVAILKFKKPETPDEINVKNLVFSNDMLDDNNSSIVEGRGVVITGYPLSLGIEDDKNHPVVRIGIIAQFTGKDYFLVDGFASHGNSGSPVFSLKYKERKLVGMVTSYINDNIALFNESGKMTAALPYNSGLARVITMKTIKEIIEEQVK
jgi:hypothetical protein